MCRSCQPTELCGQSWRDTVQMQPAPLPINLSPTDPPVVDSPVSNSQTSQPPNDIDISGHDQPQTVMPPSITTGNDSSPRRSGRTYTTPKWMDDYVPH